MSTNLATNSHRPTRGDHTMHHRRRRNSAIIAVAVTLPFLAGACSQQAKAERDGRDLAKAACDFRKATTPEQAQAAKDDFLKQLDDISKRYGAVTAEDRRDIENNLADLAEHSVQKNELLIQQDLDVLRRSAKNVIGDVGEVQASAWNGFASGVEECLQD